MRGRGRGRGRARSEKGRGRSKGPRAQSKGPNSKGGLEPAEPSSSSKGTLPPKPKAKAAKAVKGQKVKAKGKAQGKPQREAKGKVQGKAKGEAQGKPQGEACTNEGKVQGSRGGKSGSKKRSIQEGSNKPSDPVTPASKRTRAAEGVSPMPARQGKFLNSAKRRAHEKRQAMAQQAFNQLRQAGLPELSLPDPNKFDRQSFTTCNREGSKIGVILGTTSFYVYHAWVPPELASFVHNDRKGGVSIGWSSFHGLRIAWLGCLKGQ